MNATTGSHGSCMISFIRNCQSLFHNGCTFYIPPPPQSTYKTPVSQHPPQPGYKFFVLYVVYCCPVFWIHSALKQNPGQTSWQMHLTARYKTEIFFSGRTNATTSKLHATTSKLHATNAYFVKEIKQKNNQIKRYEICKGIMERH